MKVQQLQKMGFEPKDIPKRFEAVAELVMQEGYMGENRQLIVIDGHKCQCWTLMQLYHFYHGPEGVGFSESPCSLFRSQDDPSGCTGPPYPTRSTNNPCSDTRNERS